MAVEYFDTEKPAAAPPERAPRGRYVETYLRMEENQWYVVAKSDNGPKALSSMSIQFRKLGAKVSTRTAADGVTYLYVQKV